MYLVGDVHGDWPALKNALNPIPEGEHVLVLGDFGFYPRLDRIPIFREDLVKMWLRGNHEDHEFLIESTMMVAEEPIPTPGTDWYFVPDGIIFEIEDYSILIVGGGDSIPTDVDYRLRLERTKGIKTWFPEEQVNTKLVDFLIENETEIDIVLTHTPPDSFHIPGLLNIQSNSRRDLSRLQEALQPKYWFFGDMHRSCTGRRGNTKWRGLDILETFDLRQL